MATKIPKTNAMRVLDNLGVAYAIRTYDVDETDLSAQTVAKKIGLDVEQVYKTLLVRGKSGGYAFGVLAGDLECDLKALAALAGERSVTPVAVKELRGLTGYIRGGVTALAAKKAYPTFVDELAEFHDVISISAGQRGIQILLAPADYIHATSAKVGAMARTPAQADG